MGVEYRLKEVALFKKFIKDTFLSDNEPEDLTALFLAPGNLHEWDEVYAPLGICRRSVVALEPDRTRHEELMSKDPDIDILNKSLEEFSAEKDIRFDVISAAGHDLTTSEIDALHKIAQKNKSGKFIFHTTSSEEKVVPFGNQSIHPVERMIDSLIYNDRITLVKRDSPSAIAALNMLGIRKGFMGLFEPLLMDNIWKRDAPKNKTLEYVCQMLSKDITSAAEPATPFDASLLESQEGYMQYNDIFKKALAYTIAQRIVPDLKYVKEISHSKLRGEVLSDIPYLLVKSLEYHAVSNPRQLANMTFYSYPDEHGRKNGELYCFIPVSERLMSAATDSACAVNMMSMGIMDSSKLMAAVEGLRSHLKETISHNANFYESIMLGERIALDCPARDGADERMALFNMLRAGSSDDEIRASLDVGPAELKRMKRRLTMMIRAGQSITDIASAATNYERELHNRILERDNYTCQLCLMENIPYAGLDRKKPLHVHHINYHHEDNRPENMITLCSSHHAKTNLIQHACKLQMLLETRIIEIYARLNRTRPAREAISAA